MPTKRTRLPRGRSRDAVTVAAIEAWRQGDFHGLARALQIKPWQPHPWPLRLSSLGVDDGPCPDFWHDKAAWARAQQLQLALTEVAGEPPKRLMERNWPCPRSEPVARATGCRS